MVLAARSCGRQSGAMDPFALIVFGGLLLIVLLFEEDDLAGDGWLTRTQSSFGLAMPVMLSSASRSASTGRMRGAGVEPPRETTSLTPRALRPPALLPSPAGL